MTLLFGTDVYAGAAVFAAKILLSKSRSQSGYQIKNIVCKLASGPAEILHKH